MPSKGLIALASIKPGFEDRLRETLNQVGNDINGRRLAAAPRPHMDFPRGRTTHFARLAICDDPEMGPDRKRLLLATDFDGDWSAHVQELWQITSDPEAIWGCCEGYSGRESFFRFLHTRLVQPQVHYIAFPGQTVDDIRGGVQLRERLEAWLHTPEAKALAAAVGRLDEGTLWSQLVGTVANLASTVERSLSDVTRIAGAGLEALGMMLQRGPLNTVGAARRISAAIDRLWWIQLFNLLTFNAPPAPKHHYSSAPADALADCAPAEAGDEVVSKAAWAGGPSEDLVSQNQLTLITVVKPDPDSLSRLQAVLAVIDLFARRLTTPGELVGISTIHTVRWAIIDGGKRFLMVSNYDGTWESYIDEFAELILSGLNALWDTSLGFPESGAQDVAALKHFLRCHQVPANVFYSAYPTATVLNIADNQKLSQHLRRQLAGLREDSPSA